MRRGFDFLTYRKGRGRRVPRRSFREHRATFDGRTICCHLADQGCGCLVNPEWARPTMRGFKIAHGKLAQAIRAAARRVRNLERQRSRLPRRIPVGQRTERQVITLATERKHLTNLLKMVAYQAESALVRFACPRQAPPP